MTAEGDVTLALPGSWWRIPVQDEDAAARSIRAYIDSTVGRVDELAQHRAELRDHLTESVDDARRVNGQHIYLSSEIAPGVPIAITLTTYRPELPVTLSRHVNVGLAAESLAASLRGDVTDVEYNVWSEDGVAVVREFRVVYLTDENGDQERTIRIDYWLLREGIADTRLMAFSAPVFDDEMFDPLVELMDAIVATVDWDLAGHDDLKE